MAISRRLAAADPSNADAQIDVVLGLNRVGDVLEQKGDLRSARARFEESLQIGQAVAAANPTVIEAQRAASISLERLAGVLAQAGDPRAALGRFEEYLTIVRRLAAADPASAMAQRDVSVGLNHVGTMLAELGDRAGARKHFEQGLTIRKQLAKANPTSAQAQRDLMTSHVNLAELPGGDVALGGGMEDRPGSRQARRPLAARSSTLREDSRSRLTTLMATAAMDVFVSYTREDRQRVAPLVESLRASGLSVWWDADIPGGATWREEIRRHLDVAKCVIVVWSERSVSPAGEFVQDEAQRAKQRGVLLPVIIDAVTPPLGFGQTQALALTEWRGDRRDARFLDVERAAKAVVAKGPRPTAVGVDRAPPGRRHAGHRGDRLLNRVRAGRRECSIRRVRGAGNQDRVRPARPRPCALAGRAGRMDGSPRWQL